MRFVQGHFNPCITSTIGAAFTTKTVRYDKDVVRWELWDTAGQEQYNSLVPMYYRGAVGCVLVYDISVAASFNRLQRWVHELRTNGPPNLTIVLAANKADLASSGGRAVDAKAAVEYGRSIGAEHIETSALNNSNIDAIFHTLWRQLPREDASGSGTVTSSGSATTAGGVPLSALRNDPKPSSCC